MHLHVSAPFLKDLYLASSLGNDFIQFKEN